MPGVELVYWGNAQQVATASAPPPGIFNGSTATGANSIIAAMFGGETDTQGEHGPPTRSWANNPLPTDAAIDANSSTAVTDVVRNVLDSATGTTAAENGPTWGPVTAFPTFNSTSYTSAINIIDHATTPYKRVECTDSLRRTASWHMQINAMMWAGIPLPDGIQPTNDSDGTIFVYDPNYVWPGDPTNPKYWGAIWELWGAVSPEQHAARGDGITTWTAKSGGRMIGVNNRILARMTDRTTGDAASQAQTTFGAPAAPWDPQAASGKIYWGFGVDGVAELSTMLASASHIAMSHHIVTKRDVINKKIRHRIGFALFVMYPGSQGNKGSVHPATGYDGSSRTWLKTGNTLRFSPGQTPYHPPSLDPSLYEWYDMLFYAIRDYGMMLVDTTGNSFSFRGEPGLANLLPPNALASNFIKLLFQPVRDGIIDMEMIAPGTDSNFYPVSRVFGPTPLPTVPEPSPGTTLASGGNLATAIANASANSTIYLASNGTYTLTGVTTMPDTKPGLAIVTVPGGIPATINGDFQFRMYGDNQQIRRIKFVQNWVAGKNIEVCGRGQSIIDCDLTNNFMSGGPGTTAGWSSMVLTTASGPAGVVENFTAYGNFFHQIGFSINSTDNHCHAFYLSDLNGAILHSNRFYQVHGGYCFHLYPNSKNVEITNNWLYSGLFAIAWEDVTNQTTGNNIHHNAWNNVYTGMAKPVVDANTGPDNTYNRNVGTNSNTGFGGASGVTGNMTVTNNLVADPQFVSPSTGNFAIANPAVVTHLQS